MIPVVTEPGALAEACDSWRMQQLRVGFVPTMGALHEGHVSLVHAAREHGADRVALSIFVNPLQFGPSEDFSKYPRTFEQDIALCQKHGVDLVYAPDTRALYPTGFQTHVEVEQVAQGFEAAARPTHFRGVTTVVAKLLNAAGPCVAAFGRKDYQQWRVVERMVRDLDMPTEVLGCPIVRESDGLALSSRNRYLDATDRARAVAIYRGLRAADAAYAAGERDARALERAAQAEITPNFDSIDYVSLADADTLQICESRAERPSVLLVAARLGKVRLLDNAVLGQSGLG